MVIDKNFDAMIAGGVRKQTRAFKMHQKLLVDVIKRQAGTITKAITEAVMNSIEAGATKVIITTSPQQIVIEDNGAGFTARAAIEDCFETFGTPHESSEGKTWGRFRMGRGQLFSFGRNIWRTGKFEMVVDLQHAGEGGSYDIGYDLHENLPEVQGCTITIDLYEPLAFRDETNLPRDIQEAVRYVNGAVIVNGKKINVDPCEVTWDIATEACYIKRGGGPGVRIYNLGVYVETVYGFVDSADVVSTRQLDVNFARNQVIRSCPEYKSITACLAKESRARVRRKKLFNLDDLRFVASQILSGEMVQNDYWELPIFPDARGRKWSLRQMDRLSGFKAWSFGKAGDMRADRLIQIKYAFVLDEQILEWFLHDGAPELFFDQHYFKCQYGSTFFHIGHLAPSKYMPMESMEHLSRGVFAQVEDSDVTVRERLFLDVANGLQYREWTTHRIPGAREVRLAIGDALAWTDGKDTIWLSREFLSGIRGTFQGLAQLVTILAHELAHKEPSTAAHIHSQEFYEEFHAIAVKLLPHLAENAVKQFVSRGTTVVNNKRRRNSHAESVNKRVDILQRIDDEVS